MGIKEKYKEIVNLWREAKETDNNAEKRIKIDYLLQKIRIFFELNCKDSSLMNEIFDASSRMYWKIESYGHDHNTLRKNSTIQSQKETTVAKALIEMDERISYGEDKSIVDAGGNKSKGGRISIEIIKNDERMSRAFEFIEKAKTHIKIAEQFKQDKKWDKVISEAIDAIELLLKSILIISIGKYPTTHDFQDKTSIDLFREAEKVAERELGGLKNLFTFGRPFFLAHFWSLSYTYTKYSGEYGNSSNLYESSEGELALVHARQALLYAENIYNYFAKNKRS